MAELSNWKSAYSISNQKYLVIDSLTWIRMIHTNRIDKIIHTHNIVQVRRGDLMNQCYLVNLCMTMGAACSAAFEIY